MKKIGILCALGLIGNVYGSDDTTTLTKLDKQLVLCELVLCTNRHITPDQQDSISRLIASVCINVQHDSYFFEQATQLNRVLTRRIQQQPKVFEA